MHLAAADARLSAINDYSFRTLHAADGGRVIFRGVLGSRAYGTNRPGSDQDVRGIRVLFAAESGSRAWGFASPDSDWDVRAIYVHPRDWYLGIAEKPRDTFEAALPGDLDVSAWELRKALRLFAKSNVPLLEWLGSPVVYLDRDGLRDRLRALIPVVFDPRGAAWHHLAMQRGALADCAPDGSIRIKKLCYALRSALSVRWIAARAAMPPVPFPELFASTGLASSAESAVQGHFAANFGCARKRKRQRAVLRPSFVQSHLPANCGCARSR
ncbi:MAG: nucleotidyltransferase domain-containing protein [Kiritimatiellae bacterium]|nr:nucleotidyltransferase domain-containing protein [Kiritimatiellia bacterium]